MAKAPVCATILWYEKEFDNFVHVVQKNKKCDYPISQGPVMKKINSVLYKHGIVKHSYYGGDTNDSDLVLTRVFVAGFNLKI